LVMSRSNWFQCLKVAYDQLEQFNADQHDSTGSTYLGGVDKLQLIQMIEININQMPLKTLKEYIGQSTVRKEKWISLFSVLESLSKIDLSKTKATSHQLLVFWDDIIDSLMMETLTNKKAFILDSNNISEIYQSDANSVNNSLLMNPFNKHGQEEVSLIHTLKNPNQSNHKIDFH